MTTTASSSASIVDDLQAQLVAERERNDQLSFKLQTLLLNSSQTEISAEFVDVFLTKAQNILEIAKKQQTALRTADQYEQIIWWLSKRLSKVLNGKAEYLYKKALNHNKELFLKKSKSFELEALQLNTKLERKMMKVLQSSIDILTAQQIDELIEFVAFCKKLTKRQILYKLKQQKTSEE